MTTDYFNVQILTFTTVIILNAITFFLIASWVTKHRLHMKAYLSGNEKIMSHIIPSAGIVPYALIRGFIASILLTTSITTNLVYLEKFVK